MHSSTALVTASSKETSFLPLAAGYLPDTSCSVSFDSFFSPYSVSSCMQEDVFLLFQSSPAFLQLIGMKAYISEIKLDYRWYMSVFIYR